MYTNSVSPHNGLSIRSYSYSYDKKLITQLAAILTGLAENPLPRAGAALSVASMLYPSSAKISFRYSPSLSRLHVSPTTEHQM